MARWRARRLLPLLTFITLGMILGEQPLRLPFTPARLPPAALAPSLVLFLAGFAPERGLVCLGTSRNLKRASGWMASERRLCSSGATELSGSR